MEPKIHSLGICAPHNRKHHYANPTEEIKVSGAAVKSIE
jgi:hypothetical protein